MRVAAYQAPLLPSGSMAALAMIAEQVRRCELHDVDLLLCPEAVLGGLADDAVAPAAIAIRGEDGELAEILKSLASWKVTTILGFTEAAPDGCLFNSAAIVWEGRIAGVYRKRHPARRASVYQAGTESPVFRLGGVDIGLMICNDTNHPELGIELARAGAQILLVPSNNALRSDRADVVEETRATDIGHARRTGLPVVRADVAGDLGGRISLGSSCIVDAQGRVLAEGRRFSEDLLMANLELGPSGPKPDRTGGE